MAIEKEGRKVSFFGAICSSVLQYERNPLRKHIVPFPYLKKQLKEYIRKYRLFINKKIGRGVDGCMSSLNGLDQYIKEFKFEEEQWFQHQLIKTYIENQAQIMNQAVKELQESDFWEIIPLILGVDSKLVLLRELLITIDDFGFTDEQVLEIVEEDYLSYNKELCGYKLDDFTNHSLIFKVK